MRQSRLRSNLGIAPATPRKWLGLLALACLGGIPAARAAASEITLTIDCAFCGPGQSFPHDCPRVNSSAAALSNAEAFSHLVETARKETRRLRAINGISLPDLGEIGSIAQLDAALANLISATEDEIARCERERADFMQKGETADAENARLDELARQFSAEISQSRTAITAAESETAAEIRAATTARDEIVAVQKSINGIRQAITQVRNQLFPRLHQAAHHGWILPPSSYQPMPAPLPPTTQLGGYGVGEVLPASSALSTRASAAQAYTGTAPLAAAPQFAPVRRSDVQSKLEQLPALWERARTAATRRDDAVRSLEQQRTASDAQAARLAELQSQRAAALTQLAAATRNVTIARQTHAQYATRAASARAAAVHAWIEWGIFHRLEKRAADLLASGESRTGDAAFLAAWRDVATHAVQLGSDPIGVITRFPAAVRARGEKLDDLQRDLAQVREKFGVGFVATSADLPATALPYLTEDAR